jgi:RNA polymerase sigma factor (sigma-70 family)
MKILLYFLLKLFILTKCLHLTKEQFYLVNNLIKKRLTINQRETINKILYLSFEKLSIKKAIEFKKYHYHKCKDINIEDLIVSSKIGLFKSIKKYNGNSNFIYFSELYIQSELLQTLTNHFSLSIIPKKIRIKNKSNYSEFELKNYNKLLQTRLVGYSNYWQFDKLKLNKENTLDKLELFESYNEYWKIINSLKPFFKNILHLKYDFEFNKIRTNKKISELLCCSEENVRYNLIKSLQELNKNISGCREF